MGSSITGCCGWRWIKAGYDGPIEVEIFNRVIWDTDPDQVLQQMIERFIAFV